MTSLALDHLTVADTTPAQLVTVAAQIGCRAVCIFLTPVSVLARMPQFNLVAETAQRHETRQRCQDLGVSIDLAYPFTLTGRTDVASFRPAMEAAAWLGVRTLNALLYDREPQRRADRFTQFCQLAAQHQLGVAVEFYPLSQVRTLEEAISLVQPQARPGSVGVNVDLLHLVRSGGDVSQVAAAPPGSLVYAQYCDGPSEVEPAFMESEASAQRLLPGEGVFDVRGFAAALASQVRCSVEVPQDKRIEAGDAVLDRARNAIGATCRAIGSTGR